MSKRRRILFAGLLGIAAICIVLTAYMAIALRTLLPVGISLDGSGVELTGRSDEAWVASVAVGGWSQTVEVNGRVTVSLPVPGEGRTGEVVMALRRPGARADEWRVTIKNPGWGATSGGVAWETGVSVEANASELLWSRP